jgi:hypothetical protein
MSNVLNPLMQFLNTVFVDITPDFIHSVLLYDMPWIFNGEQLEL